MMKFIQMPRYKDVLELQAESCNMSMTVLDLSQTRDAAQSSAGATAVPEPLHLSNVLMWAVKERDWKSNLAPHAPFSLTVSAYCCSDDFMNFESSDSAELGGWGNASQRD